VPADLLLAGFGGLMVAVAVLMIAQAVRRPDTTLQLAMRAGTPRQAAAQQARAGRHPLLIAAAATGVGLITGFFGVGGGFVIVPALVLILGFDMPAAAATSLVVIAIDSAAAIAAKVSHGGVALNWAVTGTFAAAAIAGTLAGGHLAGRVSPQHLRTAFTALVVGVGWYTLARSLPGLA
jgi:uncharacterized protein